MGSLFKILIDAAGTSFAVSKLVLGQTVDAALNGLASYSFRDSLGKATMPQLNDEGALPVTLDAGTTLVIPATRKTQAEMEAGAGLGNRELFATLALLVDRTYTCPSMFVSATRWTLFELVMVEDVGNLNTETLIGFATLEAGQTNMKFSLGKDKFSTDALVDTKELRMYATYRDNKASDTWMKASVNLAAAS